MLRLKQRQLRPALLSAALLLLALSATVRTRAQSADVNFPTPVFSTEVTGRIPARDVGDARRTRHFYTFRGTEGDVTVTLEASELIGDVDVFTANTLRPLIKFTLFGDATRPPKVNTAREADFRTTVEQAIRQAGTVETDIEGRIVRAQ